MAYFQRPTSIDLEVENNSNSPNKPADIVEDLILVMRRHLNISENQIAGFQKNSQNNFTITMDSIESRDILMSHLQSNPIGFEYKYTPSKADIVIGHLTLKGVPAEYSNNNLLEILSEYIKVVKVKDGPQQAIGYQKEIKKTLGKTSETDAYLKFEMTSYVKCQTDL